MRASSIVLSAMVLTFAGCTTQETTPMTETTPEIVQEAASPQIVEIDPDNDPNVWMEEVEGEEALSWVRAQNERSLAKIENYPGYSENLEQMLALATDDERIPYVTIRDGLAYNFWQDETNTRGLWRRTTLESYKTDAPEWETVLDFDKLAEDEDKNWVYKGANCFKPKSATKYLCLVSLSDGGKDAVVNREFDLETKSFVEGGFETPEAKQGLAWIDQDTLLVGTDWGGDGSTLTESGYANVLKVWKRGTPLESAVTVFEGNKEDVGSFPWARELDSGEMIFGAWQATSFYTRNVYILGGEEPMKYPLPEKASLDSVYKGYQFVTLQQDWSPEGQTGEFKTGDLIAFSDEDFRATGDLPPVELVFRANDRQAVNGVRVSKTTAMLSINENVAAKILKLEPGEDGWTTTPIALPGAGQAGIAFADKDEDTVFFNYEGFLTPDSLLNYDAETGDVTPLKSLPAKFNADGLVVHQRFATSADGTEVPYFVVHRDDMKLDGATPTLLYGYGGFEVSMRPSYSGGVGRLWLEKGGAYVLANIRGGGEFGPAWHQAGLKTNRQRIYDDFIAVGEDLIERKITSPEHLGIMGGSNGGLLMGVMLTQRPDLWDAVVIQVPLLDMLRYHTLLAGASWMAEYGDPDVAEERAFLEKISPYHNFDVAADYPTPFFVTSTKDDRVHPGHARKMAKLFADAGKPFLYYENIDGGHSAAANRKESAKRAALEFTYLSKRLFAE